MRTTTLRRAGYACVRAIGAALALFALLLCARARAESDGMLRVRLARLGAPSQVTLRADCDYYLVGSPEVRIPAGSEFTISATGGSLALGRQEGPVALGPSARFSRDGSDNRGAAFVSPALSNRLCGDLSFSASGDVVTAVLNIYIEDYLYGVVGYEMPPTSGLEALKAQAIVARNYALRQKSARSGAAYDLSDTGDALAFRGYNSAAEYADAIRAVDETRGLALYYGDGLATCYFCQSNGGQTESSANALGASLPYSQVMDDPYDLEGAGVKKVLALQRDGSDIPPQLTEALFEGMAGQLTQQGLVAAPEAAQITAIEDIEPENPRFAEPSRLYRTLAFTLTVSGEDQLGQNKTARVTVRVPTYGGLEDWCDLSINAEDNETVWVSHSDKRFEITFRRSGLGLGMSQRGAQAMAKKGLDCATILDYYYPGTELRQLELNDAARGEAIQGSQAVGAQPIASARLSQKARLYDRADASGSAQTTLPAGTTAAVYDVQGQWAAVGSGDLYGFIHAEALSSFSLAGVTAAQVQDETFAQVSADAVNILQLPVETAASVGQLIAGDSVRLNAYSDAWALITAAGNVEGFIPRDALTLQADAGIEGDIVSAQEGMYGLLTEDSGLYVNADDSIAPRQTLEKGVYVQILAYNSAWASVRATDGRTGYVKLSGLSVVDQLPAQAPAEGGDIVILKDKPARYVIEDGLTLYESYSTDSPALMTLKAGDKVLLGAYNDEWACVRVNKITGFVLLSGLTDVAPETPAIEGGKITTVKGERYAVLTVDAPLYPSWSEADAPLIELLAGTRVRIGAYNSLWACVRLDGVTGFMRVAALEIEK